MTKNTVDTKSQDVVSKGAAKPEGMTRRSLLSRSGLAMAGAASAPLWMPKGVASANPGTGQHTLIIMFLRGGCDGLSMVPPRIATGGADLFYEAQRQTPGGGPQLAIPQPGPGNGVIALTDSNGVQIPWMLSEGSAAAHLMYRNQDLAFIQGVGNPVENNGSHFFSQDFVEDGTQLSAMASDGLGWGGRLMQAVTSTQPWRGMGYSKILQRTLFGAPKTIAIPDPMNFDLNGDPNTKDLRKLGLEFSYLFSDEPLKSAGADSLETVEKINNPLIFSKPSTSVYPPGSMFGGQLQKVQQLIQASADPTIDLCLETVMIDYGNWDNHTQMGPTPDTPANPSSEGMHNRMKDVWESLEAMYLDLQNHAPNANYTFVFMTEFGRRITANGSAGVDHGKGSLMAVMGNGGINGKNVFSMLPNPSGGDGVTPGWAGLQAHSELQSGAPNSYNLTDTIDYRRVLGEIMEKRVGLTPAEVRGAFPGYDYGLNPETMPVGALL